jgi:hypothetical protein
MEPGGFEGLRAISVYASRRQATVAESQDVRVWQLDRHSARAALGHDAHEHHHLVARVNEALGLKTPFGPGVPQHCEQLRESFSSPEDRFALRVASGKPKLVPLVEVVAKYPIEERGVVVRVSPPQTGEQRIPATDKLDVRRHRSAQYRTGSSRLDAIVAADELAALSSWNAVGYERQKERSRFVRNFEDNLLAQAQA